MDYGDYYGPLTDEEADEIEESPEGSVLLDGQWFPVLEDPSVVNLARFEPKVVIGDYSLESDSLISSWLQVSGVGGGQKLNIVEGTDDDRYWDSDAENEYAFQFSAGAKITTLPAGPNTDQARPLGDLTQADGSIRHYVAFGTAIRRLTSSDTYATLGAGSSTLAATPTGGAADFLGKLYVPCGGAGYSRFDETGATTHVTVLPATKVNFLAWDDRLAIIDSAGYLRFSTDGTTWTAQASRLRVTDGGRPRKLLAMETRSGELTVQVVTDRGLWAYDPLANRLVKAPIFWPAHPDQALGAATWRGSAMISVGVGVHDYTGPGGTFSAIGLDRNEGLPAHLRGRIVSMAAEYNGVYALVEGLGTSGTGEMTTYQEEGSYYDDPLYFNRQAAYASLHKWTGAGWHKKWEAEDGSGVPTEVAVSQADDRTFVVWGHGDQLYSITLRRSFHTPQQGREAGIDTFRTRSVHTTGWFDAGMLGYPKLGSHAFVFANHASDDAYVDTYYRVDADEATWLYLGRTDHAGLNVFALGVDDDGFSHGEDFQRIQMRHEWVNPESDSAIVVGFGLAFMKLPSADSKSWVLRIPAALPEGWTGRGMREIQDHLDELTRTRRFYKFLHNNVEYRVRVSQVQGTNRAGFDAAGNRLVNLIEVPIPQETFVGALADED